MVVNGMGCAFWLPDDDQTKISFPEDIYRKIQTFTWHDKCVAIKINTCSNSAIMSY